MENVSIKITLTDKISDGLKKIKSMFDGVTSSSRQATSQTDKFRSICDKLKATDFVAVAEKFERLGEVVAGAAAAGLQFRQSVADLSSITGIAGKDLEDLAERSRAIGRESGLGADTAARAYSLLASQIEISRIGMKGLNELAEQSVTLAEASGMSLDAAANALAATVNQFGLSADEAGRVTNVLAAGSKYGAAEIEDLSNSFRIAGATASAMGLSVEATAGALEILSQANLKGHESGTALRNIIIRLNTELGVDLGETSLGKALEALQPKLEDAAYLTKVFGVENIAAAQFLIQNARAVDEMTAKVTGTNTAMEQAAVRTDTQMHKYMQMKAVLEDLKITLTEHAGILAPIAMVAAENAQAIAMLRLAFGGLRGGVVRAVVGIAGMVRATATATRNFVLYGGAARGAAAGTTLLGTAARGAAAGVGMLGVALRALLVSTGIGVALMALGAAVSAFTDDTEEAAQAAESVADSYDSVKESMAGVRAQMESDLATLKNWKGNKEEEAALVDRLNNRYGETMGYFASVADWYKALTENSAAWCRQMENEARMRKLADEAAEIQQNIHDIRYNEDGTLKKYSTKRETRLRNDMPFATMGNLAVAGEVEIAGSSDVEKANAKLRGLWSSLAGVRKEMDALAKETVEYAVKGSSERPSLVSENSGDAMNGDAMNRVSTSAAVLGSIDWYEGAIRGLQEQMNATADMGLARELQNRVEMLQSALGELKIRIGIDKPEETAAAARELTQRIGDDFAAWKEENPLQPLDMEDDEDRLAGMRKGLDKVGKTAQATGQMFGALGEAFEQPAFNIMGTIAQAVATLALTFANSLKGEPSVWTWIAGAAAGTATLISTIASIRQATAFAEGGIVSGPTYALVGEYAGARNNPEVIAPLNKLRSLIEPQRGFEAGQVRFEIEGRTLVGILEKVNRLSSRR
jgi:TP901 family phage tail tape measure protein